MWYILDTIKVKGITKMYVEIAITILAVVGVILYYWHELKHLYDKARLKRMAKVIGGPSADIQDLYCVPEGINQAIARIIKITLGIDSKRTVFIFWAITFVIFSTISIMTYGMISGFLRILLVSVVSILPIVFLLARLQTLRIKSSKEGKTLVIDLLDNYKIHYYNMQHAVEVTASTIEEAPNCKRLLFNLSKGLNRVADDRQIRRLLEDFKYAIGTSWAGILTDNIFFALSSGIRVDIALEDLVYSITMAEEVEEKSKRENNEAGLIIKYLVPGCYCLTYIGAVKFFGMTSREFFHYQFGTETGLSWFVAIIVMYILSLIAKFFLTQNKLDL